jgi:3-phosphoshikimate 1-carboxyvinyltransferase
LNATIHTSNLTGAITAPRSKSVMQRACAAALLFKKETKLLLPGNSADDLAALSIIQQLGATVTNLADGSIQINSEGMQLLEPSSIHCGESGLSIRMFTPIAALGKVPVMITGEGSLLTRPMDFFDEVLPLLKVSVSSHHGKLPLTVYGPLQPINIEVDGSLSSQFLTGLLMAYTAANATGVSIKVKQLVSKPYIDLTLQIMHAFGAVVPTHDEYQEFYFKNKRPVNTEEPFEFMIEGDWSGASFLLVAGSIAGPVTVKGLSAQSLQADRKILEVLTLAHIKYVSENNSVTVFPSVPKAFEFDAFDCPDLFPPVVALAAFAQGTSRIKGLSRLRHKESDRGLTLREEFSKMGLLMYEDGDYLCVQGGMPLRGNTVSSRGDHRIAMALAIVSLRAEGNTLIQQGEAINKSYPDFFQDLINLGASVSLTSE